MEGRELFPGLLAIHSLATDRPPFQGSGGPITKITINGFRISHGSYAWKLLFSDRLELCRPFLYAVCAEIERDTLNKSITYSHSLTQTVLLSTRAN